MKQLCKWAQCAYRSKNLPRLNICRQRSIQFQKKRLKISHCGSRSPKYVELGHFTWLFCRGRQRIVPRFKMHAHSHCSAHWLVSLSSLSPSWFAKTPYYLFLGTALISFVFFFLQCLSLTVLFIIIIDPFSPRGEWGH